MNEDELKRILSKPVIDDTMDQKIANSLLLHKTNSHKIILRSFSKIAIAFIALIIVGTGTVWAAGLYVKSYPSEVNIKTYDMIDYEEIIGLTRKNEVQKSFGDGNKRIGLLKDASGNILEIDEDGYYTFEDGSKFLAPYVPDPKRHENDRKSGDQAFAEMGMSNLVPSVLYDDYVLNEGGFHYYEATYEDDKVYKRLYGSFFPDYTEKNDFNEVVYLQFTSADSFSENPGVIHLVDKEEEISNYIQDSYTNKGGIICTLLENKDSSHIIAHIAFESEILGNGRIMMEFANFKQKERIEEILDSIPITSDTVKSID